MAGTTGRVGPQETPDALLRSADALHQAQRYHDAIDGYRQALAADPLLLDAWYGLGCAYLRLEAYGDAAVALGRAVAVRPDAFGARCNLAEALFALGEIDAAAAEYSTVVESGGGEVRAVAQGALACLAPGAPAFDNFAVLTARRRWVEAAGVGIRRVNPAPPQPGRKLRVGYLSAFFGARNWMKPVWGVINRHDRDRFEIHLLSDGADPSAESGYRDHSDDRVWRIRGVSNADLAQHVVRAGLDVLVDLNGYTVATRLPFFLYRAARLQIAWFNMYATSAIDAFDILVGDDAVIPSDEERFYVEHIVRVPGSYLAFEVLYPVPDVSPPPCLRNGYVTFGCLGSAYKITEPVVAAWARILRGSPTAHLRISNRILNEPSSRTATVARFARHGITEDRLHLSGGAEHFTFLRGYDEIDIALDIFPYNGGTTTTEALWQGVPVLTFNGDRWASRTSRSLLMAAGLDEWVAADEPTYVAAASRLANAPDTPQWLTTLRARMRDRLRISRACDTAALCRSLEALYAQSFDTQR